MSAQEPTTSTPVRRWHFSLKTLLAAVVVVCATIGFIVLGRDLYQTRQELRKLRAETGHLSIDDRSQFHAIALEVAEPNTWRWRLFIPKGHRYSWNIAGEEIPKNEPPSGPSITGMSNERYWERDNEVLVTAKLRPINNDEWLLAVESRIGESKAQMYGASLKVSADKLRWMTEIPGVDGRVIGSRGTEVHDPHGPIILLQQRPCERQPDGSYRPSDHPMPGFMIWLEEI